MKCVFTSYGLYNWLSVESHVRRVRAENEHTGQRGAAAAPVAIFHKVNINNGANCRTKLNKVEMLFDEKSHKSFDPSIDM